jgi:malate synthase
VAQAMEPNVDKMEAQLKRWAARIDRLADGAAKGGTQAGILYRLSIDDLKVKRAVAQVRVDKLKAAGPGKWDEHQAGIETAWSDLETAFRDLKA